LDEDIVCLSAEVLSNMYWCESNELIVFESKGFSSCGCQTLQFIASTIFIILFIIYQVKLYVKFLSQFDSIDKYTLYMYRCLVFGCVAEAALAVVASISQPIDLALILSTILETIAWIFCAYNIHLDVWHIPVWPTWPVKLFLCMESVVILLTASSLYDNIQTTYRLILGTLAFIMVILLVLISFLKDTFRDREEVAKCNAERMVYASHITSPAQQLSPDSEAGNQSELRDSFLNPRTSSTHSSSSGWFRSVGISLQKLFRLDKSSSNPYEAVSIQEEEETKPKYSVYNIFRKRNPTPQNPWEEDRRENSFSMNRDRGRLSPKTSIAQPLVKSALERHLDGTNLKINQRSAFSREASISTRSDSPRISFNDGRLSSGNQSHAAGDRTSSSNDQSTGSKSSGALQRALDMQRSRLHGSKGASKLSAQATEQLSNGRESAALSSQSTEGGSSSKDTEYYIIIQRWVLRRPQSSHSLSADDLNEVGQPPSHSSRTSSTDNGKPLMQSEGMADFESFNLGSDRSHSPQPISSAVFQSMNANSIVNASELEFEIAVHRGQEPNIHLQSAEAEWLTSGAEISTSGRLRHEKRMSGLWTVWKTSHELYALHAALVNAYGDLAPRRPKLKCTGMSGFKISNHEIAGDMRAITGKTQIQPSPSCIFPDDVDVVFLNAILRESSFIQNVYVRGFFGLTSKAENPEASGGSSLIKDDLASSPMTTPSDLDMRQTSSQVDGSNINLMLSSNATSSNPQDKWRKLYVNMRVKIKPHEIGVRCYLFEGVVSGSEVATWLVRPSNDSSSSKPARDRIEACAIGQELVNCGLLTAIACGFEGDSDGDEGRQSSLNAIEESNLAPPSKRFSDQYGYVYRFRESSATAKAVGSSILFGAYVKVSIPHFTNAEDDEDAELTTSRDTLSVAVKSNGVIAVARPADLSGDGTALLGVKSKGHVEYLVTVEHGGDIWQIWKR
jgi:hypothetical protein